MKLSIQSRHLSTLLRSIPASLLTQPTVALHAAGNGLAVQYRASEGTIYLQAPAQVWAEGSRTLFADLLVKTLAKQNGGVVDIRSTDRYLHVRNERSSLYLPLLNAPEDSWSWQSTAEPIVQVPAGLLLRAIRPVIAVLMREQAVPATRRTCFVELGEQGTLLAGTDTHRVVSTWLPAHSRQKQMIPVDRMRLQMLLVLLHAAGDDAQVSLYLDEVLTFHIQSEDAQLILQIPAEPPDGIDRFWEKLRPYTQVQAKHQADLAVADLKGALARAALIGRTRLEGQKERAQYVLIMPSGEAQLLVASAGITSHAVYAGRIPANLAGRDKWEHVVNLRYLSQALHGDDCQLGAVQLPAGRALHLRCYEQQVRVDSLIMPLAEEAAEGIKARVLGCTDQEMEETEGSGDVGTEG